MVDSLGHRGAALANPFRNILKLAAGDFLAKTLYFLSFVYLARILGVRQFGVLEFANSLLTYFLLLSDAGLERWSVREIARTGDVRGLAGRVVPLRFLLAGAAFSLMLLLLPFFPNDPLLRQVLTLFGLCLFAQAASLKWVFMGQQKMNRVAAGLVVGQMVFALSVFAFVRTPAQLVWVPVLRLASDLALAGYFARRFAQEHGGLRLPLTLRDARNVLGPALTLGVLQALSIINYNFDAVLLGFLAGVTSVGWYSAAYKPVTVALAMPLTYFAGLFPALSSAYAENKEDFRGIVSRSLRLATSFSVPLGVGGAMLAEPIILLLFGPAYAPSVPVLRILAWSVVLVILRGTFHQALNAANRSAVDLRCAMVSAGLNVALNIVLIPHYGMIGAAAATLAAEIVWVTLVTNRLNHYVIQVNLLPYLWRPALAGAAMAACLWLAEPVFWMARAALGVGVYFGVLLLLGGANWREWTQILKRPAT
ncbi:MAG: oligosaccharide flippase family protein [Acidobacteria bacterium]|nr:oligosaccharide flippase family protein [Acidobacteriota bacterium]MBI3663299.1 oligosaccharide flippase family protein [Acidobacteriota bacterium]